MRLVDVVFATFAFAACGKSAPAPSCHDRVEAMAAHLASPTARADGATGEQIVKRILPTLAQCKPAADVFASTASLEHGVDKRAYLRDRVPSAIEACNCAADPDAVGPLLEQLFDVWSPGH